MPAGPRRRRSGGSSTRRARRRCGERKRSDRFPAALPARCRSSRTGPAQRARAAGRGAGPASTVPGSTSTPSSARYAWARSSGRRSTPPGYACRCEVRWLTAGLRPTSGARHGMRRRQAPWHFLNFLPEPHQHGSLRPTSRCSLTTCGCGANGFGGEASAVAVPAPAAAMASAPCARLVLVAQVLGRLRRLKRGGSSCCTSTWNSVSTTSSRIIAPSISNIA